MENYNICEIEPNKSMCFRIKNPALCGHRKAGYMLGS